MSLPRNVANLETFRRDSGVMRALGIIPARGGSKGVPRKNVRRVDGRPLVAYTIDAALASALLTSFVTSTDDDEIAAVAAGLGSRVLRRPLELASDGTPMLPVVEHVLATLDEDYDGLVLLQPTSPMRIGADIDAAIELLAEEGVDSVVSFCESVDPHPARMYKREGDRLVPYESEPPGRQRQDLEPVYYLNGAIYACRTELVRRAHTLIGPNFRPYLMPRERSININDEFELEIADCLLARRQFGGSKPA